MPINIKNFFSKEYLLKKVSAFFMNNSIGLHKTRRIKD